MSRPRKRARRIDADASVSVTSMMDMFTILLIYLLYFYDPNANTPNLELPSSSQKAESMDGDSLVVALDGVYLGSDILLSMTNGEIPKNVDTAPVLEALQDAIQSRNQANGVSNTGQEPALILTIRCDRRIPYQSLGPILQVAGQAGYESYRFVVLHDAG